MPARKKAAPKEKIVPVEAEVLPASVDVTSDLDDEQRAMFSKMLREHMPLEERAKQLVELASYTDTKRAPVALRAIQEINAITGVHDPKPQESTPMFVFPKDTKVNLKVEKVVK